MHNIKLKRGKKVNLPVLNEGEPALTTDEKELYIGTIDGNVKLTSRSEVESLKSLSHTHSNKSVLDSITSILINGWNNAVSHISDTIKHITSDERTLWNTVSNKVDKEAGKGLSSNDFTSAYKSKIDSMSSTATNVQKSSINGNILINNSETVVYTHPTGTNPHGTTKSDIGLSNVSNDAQVKRSEMGVASGVATLDSNGLNAQAPKAHTHDDRYYTESEADTRFAPKTHSHDDRYYTEAEADSRFATKDEIGNAGYGDMVKSVYDTNGDGVVDKAASVEWSGVLNKPSTYTPSTHTHSEYASSSHTHNYAGSSSAGGAATTALACTGNSATATKLATARTINGVAFDGTGNITITASANGGTSASCSGNSATATKLATTRTLTIGNTGKSFDGSGNVSWSLSEMGAASADHTHNYKKGGPLTWDDLKN